MKEEVRVGLVLHVQLVEGVGLQVWLRERDWEVEGLRVTGAEGEGENEGGVGVLEGLGVGEGEL